MHSQKFSILGGAMVEKNQFFSGPGPSNQSELLHRVLHIIVCSTLIDSIHPSIRIKKKKADHVMHLQNIFDFRWCHGGKKSFFFSNPGPSNQSELLRRVLHIIVCSTLIDSIHQSREKKNKN